MRLFIAIDLDAEEYFKEIQKQIPEAKASYPKVFHLTLKFLGETEKLNDVIARLKTIKFEKFSLKTTKIGVFPSEDFIRVVWMGLEENPILMELQERVENVLTGLHFKKDHEFHPHITLARIKYLSAEGKEAYLKKLKEIKFEEKEFIINEFKLIKSELKPEGPKYTDIEKISGQAHTSMDKNQNHQ